MQILQPGSKPQGAMVVAVTPSSVSAKLDSVEWDFDTAPRSEGIHDIHPYPARFIAEIPRSLIQLFHPGGDSVVFDPFCGSGTTLVEASRLGLKSIGVDLNPIATLVSRVKTTPLDAPLGSLARAIISGPAQTVPEIPRIDHWFSPAAQRALARLSYGVERVDDDHARDALRVALSRIVVTVSNQDSDTRYAAVPNKMSEDDINRRFVTSAEKVEAALRQESLRNNARGDAHIVTDDILAVNTGQVGDRVGLVVTSPPYPNAYEYWLYHKYRMYWLGMDPVSVRVSEIGARPHYFKSNPQSEVDFFEQMVSVFKLIDSTTIEGAFVCFVVGRSIIHGREIDNLAILDRAACQSGFALQGVARRSISRSKRSFNLSHASIKEEQIAVFHR